MAKKDLISEQLAQGAKDIDGFRYPVYFCTALGAKPSTAIRIEAERWVDARVVGERHFGVSQVMLTRTVRRAPRWQVRWVGNAMGVNNLRRQIRKIVSEKNDSNLGWQDL